MLESIKVTERLHWPEVEMSKHHVLNSVAVEKPPSEPPTPPSHHHLHVDNRDSPVDNGLSSSPPTSSQRGVSPPGVLRHLLSSNSYNVLLQAEDQRDRHNRHRHRHSPQPALVEKQQQQQQQQKSSPYRRAKTSTRCTASTFQKRHRSYVTSRAATAARAPGGNATSIKSHSAISGSYSNLPKSAAARSISVLGSPMGLSPRPAPRPRKACTTPGSPHASTKLPALPRPSLTDSGRKLCILTAIKPSNVDKEKVKFFKSDCAYNPQFQYSQPVSPLVLARHSHASDRFLTQAVRIMELALKKYGNYEKFEQATGGNLLTKSRVWHNVKKYMEKEGCVGEIVVHVTDDLLSRASMTVVNCRPTLTINISTAREHWLEGMLRHEIGTHYFRGINNSQQPWSSGVGRRRHGLKPLNPTEEGLASLHSVLFRKDPTLWRAALLYYTVYQAGRMSFSQLYHSLGRFVQDPATRWDYCVRAKRGQTNTALPGCFSKDQVYLDGILKILRHRDKINFPMLMALGKVSFEDVDRLKGVAQMDKVRIPHFLQDQAGYAKQLERIMEVNQLTDDELRVII